MTTTRMLFTVLFVAGASLVTAPTAALSDTAATTVAADSARLEVKSPAHHRGPLRFSWDLRDGTCAGTGGASGCDLVVVGTLHAACPGWEARGTLYRSYADTGLELVLEGDAGQASVTVVDGETVVGTGSVAAVSNLDVCPHRVNQVVKLTGTLTFAG